MIATNDSGLLSFCGRVVEQYGGLVEPCADHIMMVLPPDLAQTLDLPEETTIGPEGIPVLYGSPVLDKLVRLATRDIAIVYGKLEVPYLKREGFQDVLDRDLHMVSGRMKITGLVESVGSYITLICHYVAVSDERRDGLVVVSSSESSGCVIEGFEEFRKGVPMSQFQQTEIHQESITPRDLMLEKPVERSKVLVKDQLQEFFSAMQRRLERDVTRTCNYYSAMEKEMLERRPNSSQSYGAEKKRKIAALPGEMLSKVEELRHRYSVRVAIEVRGAIRLLVPVVRVLLQIRYRGLTRSSVVIWNPVTRRIDPVPCEICGGAAKPIYTVAKGSRLRLVCMSCSGDRISR